MEKLVGQLTPVGSLIGGLSPIGNLIGILSIGDNVLKGIITIPADIMPPAYNGEYHIIQNV